MEFVNARTLASVREKVFAAHGDPEVLARWWGPKGFRNTFEHFDFRPGGEWRFTMHGPDGKDYPIRKRFLEIVAGERIVLLNDQEQHRFTLTMSFTDAPGGATHVEWRMQFPPGSDDEALRNFLQQANEENLDRLAATLA